MRAPNSTVFLFAAAEGVRCLANRLVELLMDRGIADSAKQAISRKLAQIEERRNLLLAATTGSGSRRRPIWKV